MSFNTISRLAAAVALAVACAGSASAQTLVTSRAALGANDHVDWGQIGPVGTDTRFTPSDVLSAGGLEIRVGNPGPGGNRRIDEGDGWTGNFAPGARLLMPSEQSLGGRWSPTYFFFTTPVRGAGLQVQRKELGPFSATVLYSLVDGSSGRFDVAANSTAAADNSAQFMGLKSDSANISSMSIWMTWGDGPFDGFNPDHLASLKEYAFGELDVLTEESASAVPEPVSFALFLPALALLCWHGSRRCASGARRGDTPRLASGALALALLLSGGAASAQTIVYSGPQDIHLERGERYELDLDGNGSLDFGINTSEWGSSPDFLDQVTISSLSPRGLFLSGVGNHFVEPLSGGFLLGPASPVFSPGNPGFAYTDGRIRAEPGASFGPGPWPQGEDRFIGLSINRSGNTHYGWVRLAPSAYEGHSEVIIRDWAYNSTADGAILTGQTEDSPAVPEPEGLVLILPALALIGCARRRSLGTANA